MKIAITGSHGLIGTALIERLTGEGHAVTPVERPRMWDPGAGTIDAAAFEGHDAIVNLAGKPIGETRWTEEHKREAHDSRVNGTALLARTIANLKAPPRVLVSGSAIGFYGDGGDEVLTEASPSGEGFLAELVRAWERATEPASDAGVRVADVRTGIVMSARGGALKRMLVPFKLGLGGRIGSGRQWFSWVAIDDEVGAICHTLTNDISGPVNLTSPNPVTQKEFAKTLGKVLHRPAVLPTPTFALAAAMGREAVEEMVLFSQRVKPGVLEATGYQFVHPNLADALSAIAT